MFQDSMNKKETKNFSVMLSKAKHLYNRILRPSLRMMPDGKIFCPLLKKRGLSLVEIMIAVLFFGIITIAISLPISNSLFVTYDNKAINDANSLARSYLKDLQDSWKLQANFDAGGLITVNSIYTDNNKYAVTVTPQDLQTNADGNVILRRITINYQDAANNTELCEIYYDYNRP